MSGLVSIAFKSVSTSFWIFSQVSSGPHIQVFSATPSLFFITLQSQILPLYTCLQISQCEIQFQFKVLMYSLLGNKLKHIQDYLVAEEANKTPSLVFKIFHNFISTTPRSIFVPHPQPWFTHNELKQIKLLANFLPCSIHIPTFCMPLTKSQFLPHGLLCSSFYLYCFSFPEESSLFPFSCLFLPCFLSLKVFLILCLDVQLPFLWSFTLSQQLEVVFSFSEYLNVFICTFLIAFILFKLLIWNGFRLIEKLQSSYYTL